MGYKDPEKQRYFQRKWQRAQNLRIRLKVLELLGGKCCNCSLTDYRVLQIDHISPILRPVDMAKKVLTQTAGTGLTRKILSNKVPLKGFQLLCANCHTIKNFEDRVKYDNKILHDLVYASLV